MGNGSTKYLSQLESYLRGENEIKQTEILWLQDISAGIINIYVLQNKKKSILHFRTNLETNLELILQTHPLCILHDSWCTIAAVFHTSQQVK